MNKRIIVGICGASGVIYGIELLKLLANWAYETHLIITDSGKKNIGYETEYALDQVESLASVVHDNENVGASVASGSFLNMGMIIAPCTIKTLSAIVNSYNNNLLVRAADVTLKEKRKLALMVRETPLHKGHLRLMMDAADLGAMILPPIPSFYHRPQNIQDIINQSLGKVLDYFGIEHNLFRRWTGD